MNATPIIPAESRLKVYVVPKNEEKARANKVKEIVASARRFPGKVIFVGEYSSDWLFCLFQSEIRDNCNQVSADPKI